MAYSPLVSCPHRNFLVAHFAHLQPHAFIAIPHEPLQICPAQGRKSRLLVQVRRFFCTVTTCARKIFVERIAPFIEPWGRVTVRLHQSVQTIGFATGGMLGARVTDRLGIPTCWMTIIRRMMALPTPPVAQVSELGRDDFSFRRGRRFGSILVDMQSHKVIDPRRLIAKQHQQKLGCKIIQKSIW